MRLDQKFFERDVLKVAPDLIGKNLYRRFENGDIYKFIITETEAYRGEEDLACHASKGRTRRTEIMYHSGGHIYMYLIYGMYWMFNIVTGNINESQAVLIRGIEGYNGPGKLTKALQLDRSFYGDNLIHSDRIWIDSGLNNTKYMESNRIGIEYAGKEWSVKPWRYIMI